MKRLRQTSLISLIRCPKCENTNLEIKVDQSLTCQGCGEHYHAFKGKNVLIPESNPLFSSSYYKESESSHSSSIKPSIFSKVKTMVPSKSVNLARGEMYKKIARQYDQPNIKILVIGSGRQQDELASYFTKEQALFVLCDIDKNAEVDVYCDAHELCFQNGIFDGVITTAVMEHVLYPEKVVAEIRRVLKKGGFVYSEIPFLQGVHEGAYDFTRFSMSGHRRLYEYFEERESGMIAGPGTTLVWALVDFGKALSNNRRFSSLIGMVFRSLFFWLKYFDFIFKNNPKALDAASCTFFYGIKKHLPISPDQIIGKYEGNKYLHV